MRKTKTRYQGSYLPHITPLGGTFFVTYRLFGSIPGAVINKLKNEYETTLLQFTPPELIGLKNSLSSLSDFKFSDNWFENKQLKIKDLEIIKNQISPEAQSIIDSILKKKKRIESKRYFKKMDDFLDQNLQEPLWLKNPEIADLNFQNIIYYAKENYDLWAFTIMSNHAHILLTHKETAPVLWKILQKQKRYSGIKSNKILGRNGRFWERESYDHEVRKGEFNRILHYILNNPVKAGFVKNWRDWKWTYCHPKLLEELNIS